MGDVWEYLRLTEACAPKSCGGRLKGWPEPQRKPKNGFRIIVWSFITSPSLLHFSVHPCLRPGSATTFTVMMAETTTLSPLNPFSTAVPSVSSPLATSSTVFRSQKPSPPKRIPSFPRSKPLRPFASIAGSIIQRDADQPIFADPLPKLDLFNDASKPVKLIEAPKNFNGGFFILNLTQAELSRRD